MADEAGQKAMLYFIEVLMNSNVPMSMSQLAGRFGGRSFTPDMRTAAGGNEDGLRAFLTKYPSLFHIEGNMVSVNTHGTPLHDTSSEADTDSSKPLVSAVELELKAVKYFQDKLLRKGPFMPIKSLAGHLSQAPSAMRGLVGPQTEFTTFLAKHKDIFVLTNDDMVTLTDDILNNPKSQAIMSRSESDSSLDSSAAIKSISKDSKSKPSPITMTASEYKTMRFLKELVEINQGKVSLGEVMRRVPDATDPIKNVLVGEIKLRDFVVKYPNIFVLYDGMVTLKKTKLNVIMAGSRPVPNNSATDCSISPPSKDESQSDDLNSSLASVAMTDSFDKSSSLSSPPFNGSALQSTHRTLNNHKGPVYHLAKLWGIIDLGRHEHVFFDRSILPDGYDDLVKLFRVGQILRFNAVRAARGSRARWRATHIWRDGEDIRSMYGTNSTFSLTGFNPSSVDDEVKNLLPNQNINSNANTGNDSYAYVDASQSNTGCIPVWTVNTHSDSTDSEQKGIPSLAMVPESKYMQQSVSKDHKNLIPGYMLVPTANGKSISHSHTNGASSPRTREMGCQTISTGDIMATQLYQEDE